MSTDARFWNGLAERYAAKPVDNPGAFERKISATRQYLEPHHEILDVGCGTGSLALLLAPHAQHVHGLDFSREMLRFANDKKQAQGIDNVTFHEGTLADAPFGPESLDGVMAWSLIHLVQDRAALLERMFQITRPGGFFVASTVCLTGHWPPYWLVLPTMRLFGKAPWVGIVSKEQVADAIRAAGFVDLQTPDVGAGPQTHFVLARKPV